MTTKQQSCSNTYARNIQTLPLTEEDGNGNKETKELDLAPEEVILTLHYRVWGVVCVCFDSPPVACHSDNIGSLFDSNKSVFHHGPGGIQLSPVSSF
jgi:hypothetical protein